MPIPSALPLLPTLSEPILFVFDVVELLTVKLYRLKCSHYLLQLPICFHHFQIHLFLPLYLRRWRLYLSWSPAQHCFQRSESLDYFQCRHCLVFVSVLINPELTRFDSIDSLLTTFVILIFCALIFTFPSEATWLPEIFVSFPDVIITPSVPFTADCRWFTNP